MEKKCLVKVHKTYREVIAICDKELRGKVLEEGIIQLDLSTQFFDGKEVDFNELDEYIVNGSNEDATFYIVGKKSTDFALKKGLVSNEGIKKINGVPFALVLL